MAIPYPDSVKRRNGWLIAPPVTRMMNELVKLSAALNPPRRGSVDQALRNALPSAIRNLRRRCRARGIDPDRVLKSTVCHIDKVAESRKRFKLNPPQPASRPTASVPKVPSKIDRLDYQSAPIRDMPTDSTE